VRWQRLPLLLLALVGCRDATEVTLDLRTDVPCAELTGVAIQMRGDDAPRTVTQSCDSGEIGTIVLVPSGSKTDALDIEIIAGRGVDPTTCNRVFGNRCIVARRRMRYLPHKGLSVPIDLRGACGGVACGDGATCADGLCHPSDIDPGACTTPAGCGENALGPPIPTPPPPPPPPPPPTTGPTFVNANVARDVGGVLTLPVPSGIVAGDRLYFAAFTDLTSSTFTLPAEWSALAPLTSTKNNWNGWVSGAIATGNETTLVVRPTGLGVLGAAGIYAAYRGVSATTPVDGQSFVLVNDATKGTAYTSPSLQTSVSNGLLVLLFISDATAGGGATRWGVPPATMMRAENAHMLLVDVPVTAPGTTPPYTAIFDTGSGAVAAGVLVP
jgi:hypothetical protein